VKKSEIEVIKCMETNVVGTFNIIKSINENNIKLVHISTEHVFDGEKGDYTTNDLINPITKYAKSKAAAEIIATMYSNSLIIRTSFYSHTFPYEKAFTDQWTTKDYIDIIAPKILKLALSDKKGIHHCCSKKRTIYDIAKIRNPNVKPFSRAEINFPTPKDTSLICTEE
jgi:dTDP-4-dehydrorhamnose reductase